MALVEESGLEEAKLQFKDKIISSLKVKAMIELSESGLISVPKAYVIFEIGKEAQGILEMKISKLEAIIANARLIDESGMDTSKIYILSKVKLKNHSNGSEMQLTLVAENEADLKQQKLSVSSPIGKGLLGKSKGDIAEISTPGGIIKFEILEISR